MITIAHHFFSADELEIIGDRLDSQSLPRVGSAPSGGSDVDPAPFKLMYKSVVQAREDERKMKELRGEVEESGYVAHPRTPRMAARACTNDGSW